jgi:hypothetical protein
VIAEGTSAEIAAQTGTTSLEGAFVSLTGRRDAAEASQELLRALGNR